MHWGENYGARLKGGADGYSLAYYSLSDFKFSAIEVQVYGVCLSYIRLAWKLSESVTIFYSFYYYYYYYFY